MRGVDRSFPMFLPHWIVLFNADPTLLGLYKLFFFLLCLRAPSTPVDARLNILFDQTLARFELQWDWTKEGKCWLGFTDWISDISQARKMPCHTTFWSGYLAEKTSQGQKHWCGYWSLRLSFCKYANSQINSCKGLSQVWKQHKYAPGWR